MKNGNLGVSLESILSIFDRGCLSCLDAAIILNAVKNRYSHHLHNSSVIESGLVASLLPHYQESKLIYGNSKNPVFILSNDPNSIFLLRDVLMFRRYSLTRSFYIALGDSDLVFNELKRMFPDGLYVVFHNMGSLNYSTHYCLNEDSSVFNEPVLKCFCEIGLTYDEMLLQKDSLAGYDWAGSKETIYVKGLSESINVNDFVTTEENIEDEKRFIQCLTGIEFNYTFFRL